MARLFLFLVAVSAYSQTIDWPAVNREALQHFQALVRLETVNPPGNETRAVDYLRRVLEGAGIATKTLSNDPARANLVARIPGNGSKRPLLIMAHTDTVTIDPSKWVAHGPFSADLQDGYIYGRGTVDDKDGVTGALMTALLLKRNNVRLDRDIIFLFESGEEASTKVGIEHVVNNHWNEIEAEVCLAETGGVEMRGGKAVYATIQAAEKQPFALKLTSRGPAGHGSVPLQSNAVVHLTQAVSKIAAWRPPMRMIDTTRTYFERLANIANAADADRYKGLADPARTDAAQAYLAEREPSHNSMLRTSISPTQIQAGYQINVIPSQATAMLDVRALPGENMDQFIELLRGVVNDPAIEIARENMNARPPAPASPINTPAYQALEQTIRRVYNVPVLPTMSTGATDMAFVRAKGTACYGIGPAVDSEDGALGFGAHSDQERIRETSLYDFVRLNWEAVNAISAAR